MIDIRYHIYSLAAVFFALAVGIAIGATFAKRSPLVGLERSTIVRYENTTRQLKREIEMAADESNKNADVAKKCEEFCRVVMPTVVKDRLAWRNAAIIQTGDYDELTGNVKLALELAGARVNSVTDINRTFPFNDDAKVSAVLINCGMTPPGDPTEARKKLFAIIANLLCNGQYHQMISQLENSGIAKFNGEYTRYNRLIVLVGGSKADNTFSPQTIDSQLIAQFTPDIIVVGCEGVNSTGSYVSAWHKSGIATVDNVDSAIGQVDLVCALGGEKAQFGVKETADRLIPQSLEKR